MKWVRHFTSTLSINLRYDFESENASAEAKSASNCDRTHKVPIDLHYWELN
jgi:hypothetical protein